MADKNYSGLTVIIATAKDCVKCTSMKNQGTMKNITDGFRAKGIKVVEKLWESRNQPFPVTDRISEYLNQIVGWFPQFIVLPTSYYDNADKYSVKELIEVSHTFNGVYNNATGLSEQKTDYNRFDSENFGKFFDKYLASPEYKKTTTSSSSISPMSTSFRSVPQMPRSTPSSSSSGTPGLNVPSFTEPAYKSKECGKSEFVLFSRGI